MQIWQLFTVLNRRVDISVTVFSNLTKLTNYLFIFNTELILHTNTVKWCHLHKIDASIDVSASSLSLLVSSSSLTATATTYALSESVPFFFYSHFHKDNFCQFELKKIWRRWDLKPLPSNLIHDKLDHRTMVSCSWVPYKNLAWARCACLHYVSKM